MLLKLAAVKKKKSDRDVQVLGFEAEPALREKIDQIAEEQDRSRSWVIRQLLMRALETQKEKATA